MAGAHNPDDLVVFVLRLPKPLKDMVKLYAEKRHLSMNMAFRELVETNPSLGALYRHLLSE